MIFVAIGTENPAEEEDRVRVAVSDQCGGSYCITQRWIHRHDVLSTSKGIIYIHCTCTHTAFSIELYMLAREVTGVEVEKKWPQKWLPLICVYVMKTLN